MKTFLSFISMCCVSLCIFVSSAYAQPQTIVGVLVSGVPQFVTSDSILKIAFAVELNNGTVFSSVVIDTDGSDWHLIGYGSNGSTLVTAHVPLSVDGNGSITLALIQQPAHICSTTDCINHCNWQTCSCNVNPGTCTLSSGASRQAGYLGSFY